MASTIPANKFKSFPSKSYALAFAKKNSIDYPKYTNTKNYSKDKVNKIKQNLFLRNLNIARIQAKKRVYNNRIQQNNQTVAPQYIAPPPVKISDSVIYKNVVTDKQKSDKYYLYRPIQKALNQSAMILVIWRSNGEIKKSKVVTSTGSYKRNWTNNLFWHFQTNSRFTMFEYKKDLIETYMETNTTGDIFDDADVYEQCQNEHPDWFVDNYDEILIVKPDIKQDFEKDEQQYFLDNKVGHCFFSPIKNWVESQILKVKKNYNYKVLNNKLDKYIVQYSNGISVPDIKKVAIDLCLNLIVKDIVNNELVYAKSTKKALRNFNYVNTRYNHVDCVVNESNKDEKKININDMIQLSLKLKTNKEHFLYNLTTYILDGKEIQVTSNIITKDCKYSLINETNNTIIEFNKSIGIDKLKYDFIKDNNKYKFISKGVRYVSHFSYVEDIKFYDEKDYMEYDLKKAYTQGNKENLQELYVGYPTVMTQPLNVEHFTIDDIRRLPGYYRATIVTINYKNDNQKKHLDMIEMVVGGSYILTSPEILYFNSIGIVFTFSVGSYSFKSINIPFTKEMIEKKCYTKWGGMLNMANMTQSYMVDGEKEYLDAMRDNNKRPEMEIRNFNNVASDSYTSHISIKKKSAYTSHHIGGFITAYTRINVFKKLFDEVFEDIIGYKLDGYVVKKNDNIKLSEIWQLKEAKIDFGWGLKPYYPGDEVTNIKVGKYSTDNIIDKGDFHQQYLFLSGQGGSGKTHTYLSQRTDGIFTSRIWKLCIEKQKDYKVQGLCINRLLDDATCEPYLIRNNHPSFIFIDESNMIPLEWIENVIKTFPFSQIILAGDLNIARNNYYQCGFSDITNFFNDKRFNYITFDKSYRCKDETLRACLAFLRDGQDKSMDINVILSQFIKYVKASGEFNIISENLVETMYNYKTDWILCSTKESDASRSKFWTNTLKGKKFIVTHHNEIDLIRKRNGDIAYLNGDIIVDPVDTTKLKGEYRDGFTIHSFQGITVSGGRLFIDLKQMFDPRQLYTAISRVETLDQIWLIK